MSSVYIGIGSNIRRETSIRLGLAKLAQAFGVITRSAIYASSANGFDGPDFYNLVVHFNTSFPLSDVATKLRQIEFECGRPQFAQKCSSRTLDIDILLYDKVICDTPCELPRPEIVFNSYVLRPLSELAGDLLHPITMQPLSLMWKSMEPDAIPLTLINDNFLNDSSAVYDHHACDYAVPHSGAY